MSPLLIAALGILMVATVVPVGAVRHGGRADPDRRAAGHPAVAVGDGAARDHADGLQRLARAAVAGAYPLAAGDDLPDRLRAALAVWSIARYVPDKPVALLLLGVTPFMARLTPKGLKPNPDSVWQGSLYGSVCMGLMLMTGVSGPLMDTFFLGGNLDRREVVATKATCQVASHLVKLTISAASSTRPASLDPVLAAVAVAASMLGTTLARRFLEAMSDAQFRTWANRIITTVASYYIIYGGWLLLERSSALAH